MGHIKIPIRVKQGIWAGDILDADGNNICEMREDAPFPMACEMVNAVNQHDALVAACEAWMKWYDAGMPRSKPTFIGVKTIHTNADQLTRAALALVKGADADQD